MTNFYIFDLINFYEPNRTKEFENKIESFIVKSTDEDNINIKDSDKSDFDDKESESGWGLSIAYLGIAVGLLVITRRLVINYATKYKK